MKQPIKSITLGTTECHNHNLIDTSFLPAACIILKVSGSTSRFCLPRMSGEDKERSGREGPTRTLGSGGVIRLCVGVLHAVVKKCSSEECKRV